MSEPKDIISIANYLLKSIVVHRPYRNQATSNNPDVASSYTAKQKVEKMIKEKIMAKKKKIKKEEFEVEIIDKFSEEDLFDDCSVCQAVKFAQENGKMPTLSELEEAFRKTKKRGGIVGGEWFEEKQQ